jgi:hypothetical protein
MIERGRQGRRGGLEEATELLVIPKHRFHLLARPLVGTGAIEERDASMVVGLSQGGDE